VGQLLAIRDSVQFALYRLQPSAEFKYDGALNVINLSGKPLIYLACILVVSYTKYLRRKGKRYQSRRKSCIGRSHIKNRVSVDVRSAIAEEKSSVWDWGIDLVIGKVNSGALVTIVDRVTNFTVSK
jgi:IS30 family transposase